MFEVEEGSLESVILQLQEIGLELNEFKKHQSEIQIESYEELLDFSINSFRAMDEHLGKVTKYLEEIQKVGYLKYDEEKEDDRNVPIETNEKVFRFLGIPLFKITTRIFGNK